MDPIASLLIASAMAVLAGLLALTAIIGGAVAVRPALLERLRRTSDRRYSLRRATGPLDRPRNIDRWFYRHHRAYGTVVVLLALFLLYFLAFGELRATWALMMGAEYRDIAELLGELARILLWIGAVLALLIGTVVFVRPSALKTLETGANRWLTLRRATRSLDREYGGLDARVARRPRLWGTITAVSSVVLLIALIVQWRMSGIGF
jgi:hypothetical protein